MKTTTIKASEDYLLHITVSNVPAINAQHLLIQSQWTGAKRPGDLQTRLSLTLPPEQMGQIAKAIQEAT